MAQNDVTALQWAGGRLPPVREPGVEQFVRAWLVGPDRDRVDRAESRSVEHEPGPVGGREQHVVRVFVLNDDVRGPEWRLLSDRPAKHALQRREGCCGVPQKKCLTHSSRIQRVKSPRRSGYIATC